MNSDFVVGQLAWSPADGFARIAADAGTGLLSHGSTTYSPDGRLNSTDEAPTLLTVADAKLLGYSPPQRTVTATARAWGMWDPATKSVQVITVTKLDPGDVPAPLSLLEFEQQIQTTEDDV